MEILAFYLMAWPYLAPEADGQESAIPDSSQSSAAIGNADPSGTDRSVNRLSRDDWALWNEQMSWNDIASTLE